MTGGLAKVARRLSSARRGFIVCAIAVAVAAAALSPPATAKNLAKDVKNAVLGRDDRRPLPPDLTRRLSDAIGLLVVRRFDPETKKWRTSSCTASCVAPHILLTAAHCVMEVRARRLREGRVDMGSMVFVLRPWDRAHATRLQLAGLDDAERRALMRTGAGNTRTFDGNFAKDWALLALARKTPCPRQLPVKALPVDDPRITGRGKPLMIVGFQGDKLRKKDRRLYYSTCRATRDKRYARLVRYLERSGQKVLLHFCDAAKGSSGAPVLVRDGRDGFATVAVYSGTRGRRFVKRSRLTGRVVRKKLLQVNTASAAVNFLRALQEMQRELPGKLATVRSIKSVPLADVRDRRAPLPPEMAKLENAIGLLRVPFRRNGAAETRKFRYCTATCLAPEIVLAPAHCVLPARNDAWKPDFADMKLLFWSRNTGKRQVRFAPWQNGDSPIIASGYGKSIPRHLSIQRNWALLHTSPGSACHDYLGLSSLSPDDERLRRAGNPLRAVGHEMDWLKKKDLRLAQTPCRSLADRKRKGPSARGRGTLLLTNCIDRKRLPGAPILLDTPQGPRLVGMHIAFRRHLRRHRGKDGLLKVENKARLVSVGVPATNVAAAFRKVRRAILGQ